MHRTTASQVSHSAGSRAWLMPGSGPAAGCRVAGDSLEVRRVYADSVKRDRVPLLTEASEYAGQSAIAVACTQLGAEFTASRAKRIVDEWVDLLGTSTELSELQFRTRTPKRLFAALAGQPQLERLTVKWGDYADLRPLEAMTGLRHLELRGASAVTDVSPLATLDHLELLALEGFRAIEDPTPLTGLCVLSNVELGGAWMTPRNAHISTISFMREMPTLTKVLLHTLVVDDRDYSPLFTLPHLKWVRVKKVRGMRPEYDELRRRLPWSA